jgi:hypothetical protein
MVTDLDVREWGRLQWSGYSCRNAINGSILDAFRVPHEQAGRDQNQKCDRDLRNHQDTAQAGLPLLTVPLEARPPCA